MITSTERLYLRELTINDAIHFCNMNNDPMCVKYTGYNPFGSIIASNLFLESYKNNIWIMKWEDGQFALKRHMSL